MRWDEIRFLWDEMKQDQNDMKSKWDEIELWLARWDRTEINMKLKQNETEFLFCETRWNLNFMKSEQDEWD